MLSPPLFLSHIHQNFTKLLLSENFVIQLISPPLKPFSLQKTNLSGLVFTDYLRLHQLFINNHHGRLLHLHHLNLHRRLV